MTLTPAYDKAARARAERRTTIGLRLHDTGEWEFALVDARAEHRQNPAWFPNLPLPGLIRILREGDIVLVIEASWQTKVGDEVLKHRDVEWTPIVLEIQARHEVGTKGEAGKADTFEGRCLPPLDYDEYSFRAWNIAAVLYCPRSWNRPGQLADNNRHRQHENVS
jgi:hypothetical protein